VIFKKRASRPPSRIDHRVAHGVYVYDPDGKVWSKASPSDALEGSGLRVVYFGNTRCAACTVFNVYWNILAERISKNGVPARLVAVICGWFSGECASEDAKRLFKRYSVSASPTILFLCGEGADSVVDRVEGVWDDERLLGKIKRLIEEECKKG